jgi:hypothetical protein
VRRFRVYRAPKCRHSLLLLIRYSQKNPSNRKATWVMGGCSEGWTKNAPMTKAINEA